MDCIFCKIVKGELPANIIYEDESIMCFLDIYPFNEGHALII
ncbi:MAG: HIT family protein, partial [Paraclostridium sp.]